MGSGCGSVGRAVASNTRGAQLESSYHQSLIMNILTVTYRTEENKEKEAGNGPI